MLHAYIESLLGVKMKSFIPFQEMFSHQQTNKQTSQKISQSSYKIGMCFNLPKKKKKSPSDARSSFVAMDLDPLDGPSMPKRAIISCGDTVASCDV